MGSAEMDRVWQERAIRSWFSMWLEGKAGDLTALYRELGAGVPRCVPGLALVPGVEHPRAGPGLGTSEHPARRGPLCGGVVLQKYGGWQDGGI